jgi:hypothetical protein
LIFRIMSSDLFIVWYHEVRMVLFLFLYMQHVTYRYFLEKYNKRKTWVPDDVAVGTVHIL